MMALVGETKPFVFDTRHKSVYVGAAPIFPAFATLSDRECEGFNLHPTSTPYYKLRYDRSHERDTDSITFYLFYLVF